MSKTKFITGILLVLAVLFAQVGTVLAAPAAQTTTPVTGKVTNIELVTDTTGAVVAVDVTLQDETSEATQTVRVSLADAQSLGLVEVTTDADGKQVVTILDQTGRPALTIDPGMILPVEEEAVNPVAAILAKFFDLDPTVVQGYHEDGFGFGVIAQALWMQKNLADEDITAEMILQAKQNHDYSSIILEDGTNPTNWGQFKKALLDKKNNLGVIVSGQVDPQDPSSPALQKNNNGKGKDNNPGKGNNKKP